MKTIRSEVEAQPMCLKDHSLIPYDIYETCQECPALKGGDEWQPGAKRR